MQKLPREKNIKELILAVQHLQRLLGNFLKKYLDKLIAI